MRAPNERGQFMMGQTQATHAGFDFEMDWIGSGARCRGPSQCREHGRVAYDRGQSVGEEILELFLEDRSQDDDRHLDAGLPKCNPFSSREDGKAGDAMPYQRP